MRILIVEDEKPAARQIKLLLKSINPSTEVIGVIDNVEDLAAFLKSSPTVDLILSDIQLGDGLSFDAYDQFKTVPPIIFTTAYDEYAIKAFKTNSIDYLVKPIELNSLQQAIDKLVQTKTNYDINFQNLLEALTNTASKASNILVQKGESIIAVKQDDIALVYTQNKLVYLQTAKTKYVISQTIDELNQLLNPKQFFKINRQSIISKRAIESAEPTLDQGLKLTISTKSEFDLKVSRRRVSSFKTWWIS